MKRRRSPPRFPAIFLFISIVDFLTSLWNAGAFLGATPSAAFFVRCDSSTTSNDDIENGVVNVIVGIAPVNPAEFVILQIAAAALPSTRERPSP
jgi:phage tail sheath protein FI